MRSVAYPSGRATSSPGPAVAVGVINSTFKKGDGMNEALSGGYTLSVKD